VRNNSLLARTNKADYRQSIPSLLQQLDCRRVSELADGLAGW
jgi:hypothetical protein